MAAESFKNALRIEINGTEGSLAFDFEENNLLQFFDGTKPAEERGFVRILVTEPEHPYLSAWWPPGHGLGYEHGFTHQVVDLIAAIAENRQPTPSFEDGLCVQRVLDAVVSEPSIVRVATVIALQTELPARVAPLLDAALGLDTTAPPAP